MKTLLRLLCLLGPACCLLADVIEGVPDVEIKLEDLSAPSDLSPIISEGMEFDLTVERKIDEPEGPIIDLDPFFVTPYKTSEEHAAEDFDKDIERFMTAKGFESEIDDYWTTLDSVLNPISLPLFGKSRAEIARMYAMDRYYEKKLRMFNRIYENIDFNDNATKRTFARERYYLMRMKRGAIKFSDVSF